MNAPVHPHSPYEPATLPPPPITTQGAPMPQRRHSSITFCIVMFWIFCAFECTGLFFFQEHWAGKLMALDCIVFAALMAMAAVGLTRVSPWSQQAAITVLFARMVTSVAWTIIMILHPQMFRWGDDVSMGMMPWMYVFSNIFMTHATLISIILNVTLIYLLTRPDVKAALAKARQ
jgi:hypothetical protein